MPQGWWEQVLAERRARDREIERYEAGKRYRAEPFPGPPR